MPATTALRGSAEKEIAMALDVAPLTPAARTPSGMTGAAVRRGRGAPERRRRAAVRRRFDEAALAAAIRELRTHRRSRATG
jgi:hypothetical protein